MAKKKNPSRFVEDGLGITADYSNATGPTWRFDDEVPADDAKEAAADYEDRAVGALLGLAVGDAVGTTVEFRPRGSFAPLTDMVGGGPFGLSPGEWTDDTSMALALADSLLARGGADEQDMAQRFLAWWRSGQYSHNGRCFDIGGTTAAALSRFERSGNPIAGDTRPDSAGNGSLMRLAPAALWGLRGEDAATAEVARRQSHVTHGAEACLDACEAFAIVLRRVMRGEPVGAALSVAAERVPGLAHILLASNDGRPASSVQSTGYVLHTLDAALWAVANADDFRSAVLLAANLGDDADTTAAVAGQLAGAIHGASGIPAEWLERLAWRDRIEAAALALL